MHPEGRKVRRQMGEDRYCNSWNASSKPVREFESICNGGRRGEGKKKKGRDKKDAFIVVLEQTSTRPKKIQDSSYDLNSFQRISFIFRRNFVKIFGGRYIKWKKGARFKYIDIKTINYVMPFLSILIKSIIPEFSN